MNRRTKTGVVAIVVMVAAIGAWRWNRTVGWRVEAITSKLTGSMPDVTWSDVGFVVSPGWVQNRLHPRGARVTGQSQGEAPCSVLWSTARGSFWGPPEAGKDLEYILRYQLPDTIDLHGPLAIRRGDVVIDGGSHLGTFTRLALNHGASKVVAFDPDAANDTCFKQTFRQEIADGRVVLVEAALWRTVGVLEFAVDPTGLSGAVSGSLPDTEKRAVLQVPATTIDATVASLPLDRVDFIKLHVEGAEADALAGAAGTVGRFLPRLMVSVQHRDGQAVAMPAAVRALSSGYQVLMRDGNLYAHAAGPAAPTR